MPTYIICMIREAAGLGCHAVYSTCHHARVKSTMFVFQGERGPVGPAVIGPRGIPGIPGERGELVGVPQLTLNNSIRLTYT